MTRSSLSCFAAALALSASTALPAMAQTRDPAAVAAAALNAAPVFDGHNDVPEQLRSRVGNVINDFDFHDTAHTARDGKKAMHTDIRRMRAGRVGAQWWSVWVDAELPEPQMVQAVLEQIDVTNRLIARYPRDLAPARTAADVERAMMGGRIASLIGMEGGGGIGNSLGVLRQMYDAGVRYMTITHWKTLDWADAATDAPRHDGLTDMGKDVIREMNRLGMVVDLSHVSEATMMDALDVTTAPVMFSHSGARAVNPHPRNVPDAVLDRVKANGGIVMAVFYTSFVSPAVRDWEAARSAEEARLKALHLGNPKGAADALDAWVAANPRPQATLSETADHIDHLVKRMGVDHVGVGGDYDGMSTVVQGLEDVSTYPALFTELARRGYSQGDLEKIASRNMLRVLRGVEAAAARARTMPPVERPVARGE